MEEALGAVACENIATPDAGGSSTNEVVDAVLTAIMNPNRRTQEDLLIVVDMQGDFLAADGRCAQLGLIDSAKIIRTTIVSRAAEACSECISRGIRSARRQLRLQ